jgi:hypothetical protein
MDIRTDAEHQATPTHAARQDVKQRDLVSTLRGVAGAGCDDHEVAQELGLAEEEAAKRLVRSALKRLRDWFAPKDDGGELGRRCSSKKSTDVGDRSVGARVIQR